jgi:hypothetical protein
MRLFLKRQPSLILKDKIPFPISYFYLPWNIVISQLLVKSTLLQPGMVEYIYSPSTQEAEAVGSRI